LILWNVIDEIAVSPALRSQGTTLRVDEVMGPAVVVHEQTTLRDIACLMLARHVQSVVVVDDRAQVVGVVTERQLTLSGEYLRLATLEVPEIAGRWVTAHQEVDAACIAARTVKAREIMERRLTRACADETVGAAVERMRRREAEHAGCPSRQRRCWDARQPWPALQGGGRPDIRKPAD
jgi:CBS domain-containing protein